MSEEFGYIIITVVALILLLALHMERRHERQTTAAMPHRDCPVCGSELLPAWYAGSIRAWTCLNCGHFEREPQAETTTRANEEAGHE